MSKEQLSKSMQDNASKHDLETQRVTAEKNELLCQVNEKADSLGKLQDSLDSKTTELEAASNKISKLSEELKALEGERSSLANSFDAFKEETRGKLTEASDQINKLNDR